MTELYLIAHRVRSEPAFDIAERMTCACCTEIGNLSEFGPGCHECDSLGYWWIIGTSGHRAYPWWSDLLTWYLEEMVDVPPMPASLPDHYPIRAEPTHDLTALLGLIHAPLAPIKRRF